MDINAIIRKIDEFLEQSGKASTNPVEANAMLAKAGLLRDSDLRQGLPLRNILRAGLISHAYQTGGKGSSWVIPHSVKAHTQKSSGNPKHSDNPLITLEANMEKKERSGPNLFDNISKLQNAGFEGFLPIATLVNNTTKIPVQKGIYFVIYNSTNEPNFNSKGSGGFFKGKDPNISIPQLKENWVPGSLVIYIGKAGGSDSSATLRSRLTQYLRFGQGEVIGHYGGRYIWQIENPGKLIICWESTPIKEPRDEEALYIKMFVAEYGKRPFANLVD